MTAPYSRKVGQAYKVWTGYKTVRGHYSRSAEWVDAIQSMARGSHLQGPVILSSK